MASFPRLGEWSTWLSGRMMHHLSFYPSHRVMTIMQRPCFAAEPAIYSKIPFPLTASESP